MCAFGAYVRAQLVWWARLTKHQQKYGGRSETTVEDGIYKHEDGIYEDGEKENGRKATEKKMRDRANR